MKSLKKQNLYSVNRDRIKQSTINKKVNTLGILYYLIP